MWYTGLAIENCAQGAKLFDHLAFKHTLAACTFLSLEGTNPTNVAHGRFHTFHVELVFETDRKPVQWTDRSFLVSVVLVESLRIFNRCFEENLMEAIGLGSGQHNVPAPDSSKQHVQVGGLNRLYGRRLL